MLSFIVLVLNVFFLFTESCLYFLFFSSLNFLRVTVSYKCSNREVAFIVSLSIGKGAGITFDMMSLTSSVSSQIFVFLQLCHWRSYCSDLGEFVGDKFLPALFKIIRCEPFLCV